VIETWGQDHAGSDVHRITLERDGLSATILSYGAILQDIRIVGHNRSLVLGYQELSSYLGDDNYFGAIVGRVANRIANGTAVINGSRYVLDRNTEVGHQLHGGRDGTFRRTWDVVEHSSTHVTLQDTLPDGHMGYPGNLTVTARYEILPDQVFSLEIEAVSDAPTLCNFAHHSYFNLGNSATIDGHQLQAFANRYVAVDGEGVPTGEVTDVSKTDFDFRIRKQLNDKSRYDHNLCLSDQRQLLRQVARLCAPDDKITLSISTTEAGLQVYTGHGISGMGRGTDGLVFGSLAGIALEPQAWPDAVNHEGFPCTLLMPEQTYRQRTQFQFTSENLDQG
jgi:aldose 1-epimerase